MRRVYRSQIISYFAKLISLDGIDLSPAGREEQTSITYEAKTVEPAGQNVVLFIIDDIQGLPQPDGYKVSS